MAFAALIDGDKFAFGTYVPNVISEPIVNDRVDMTYSFKTCVARILVTFPSCGLVVEHRTAEREVR